MFAQKHSATLLAVAVDMIVKKDKMTLSWAAGHVMYDILSAPTRQVPLLEEKFALDKSFLQGWMSKIWTEAVRMQICF